MRACRKLHPGADLELTQADEPVPRPDEFVIDVHAVDLCHTDVTVIDGPGDQWPAHMPIILGHDDSIPSKGDARPRGTTADPNPEGSSKAAARLIVDHTP